MRRDTRDTEDDYKMVENALAKNDSKMDASSMSIVSAATSISDLNESRDEITDFEPFFLQVSITIRYGKDTMITTPIMNLPTCLIDLLKTMEKVEEIDLARFSVSLDLMSISLSHDSPLPIGGRQKGPGQGRARSVSLCSNLSFTDHQRYLYAFGYLISKGCFSRVKISLATFLGQNSGSK